MSGKKSVVRNYERMTLGGLREATRQFDEEMAVISRASLIERGLRAVLGLHKRLVGLPPLTDAFLNRAKSEGRS